LKTYIICLEDGKEFKSLKRHLNTHFDLSPEACREKWCLPRDYPIVAPAYAAARSNLAKSRGLGQRKTAAASRPAAEAVKESLSKRRALEGIAASGPLAAMLHAGQVRGKPRYRHWNASHPKASLL
jgi:ROS/MUCR transcriptional regulator protein